MEYHRLFAQLIALTSHSSGITFAQLQKKLALDRNSLSAFIKKLQGLGLQLIWTPELTLLLKDDIQVLSSKDILSEYFKLSNVHEIDVLAPFLTLDSTNQYIKNTKKHFSDKSRLCVAEHQSVGRGRQEKRWVSSVAKNVTMSLQVRLAIPVANVGGVSLVTGISIVDALNELGVKELRLKWPNDIYWRGQKLVGILIESIKLDKISIELVVGIGLNVEIVSLDAEKIDQNWIDLSQIMSKVPSRNVIIARIVSHLLSNFSIYERLGFEAFMSRWQKLDYLLNKQISLTSVGGCTDCGVAVGINEQGELLMRKENNNILKILAGDVSVRWM